MAIEYTHDFKVILSGVEITAELTLCGHMHINYSGGNGGLELTHKQSQEINTFFEVMKRLNDCSGSLDKIELTEK